MSINEELSFTEYTLTEDTTDFIISFDRIGGSTDEVSILVNNTPIEDLVGYTVLQVNFSTWQVDPALPAGTVVRLARTTNLDKMVYVFTAGSKFIAKNVDDNFKQIQHSQQEIRDRQDKLEDDATALLLEINDVKVIAEQAAADANEALEKVDDILNTGVVPAGMILTKSGQNQQQVNDFGGAVWYLKVGGYDVGATAKLNTGDTVQSTIPNNTNDPNADMTGWVQVGNTLTVRTIAEMLTIQNPKDGMLIFVKSFNPVNFALATPYLPQGGGVFTYVPSLSSRNDGGACINGWVRVDTSNLNAYDFGAYGDWNATDQIGHDDTLAFQNYAAYLINYENNPREGGSRIMRVLAGNYRLDGFTITQGSAYWSFNLVGEGQLSQLWFNPNGQGIVLEQENSVFKDITLNGKLDINYTIAPIEYIVRAKLANKILDVDLLCENVNVFWFKNFARVAGRGFTFNGGTVGIASWGGSLCEIACDADLVPAGDLPVIHQLSTAMRHFKVDGVRFDGLTKIFTITGTHALKDYINGLSILNSELTLVTQLVYSADCTLISPKFANNLAIGCFKSSTSSGAIEVPRAKNVTDVGNSWNNYINEDNVASSRELGISFIHRYVDIDGLTVTGTTAKDLVFGLLKTTGPTKNITIVDNTLLGFGDFQNSAAIIESTLQPENVIIKDNNVRSKTSKSRRWVSAPMVAVDDIVIKDNICDNTFPAQALTYSPKLMIDNAVSTTANISYSTSHYWVEGSYIRGSVILVATETATAGLVGITLPVPAITKNGGISNIISGNGTCGVVSGFTLAQIPSVVVRSGSEQVIRIQKTPNTFLSWADKTGAFVIEIDFFYRFK